MRRHWNRTVYYFIGDEKPIIEPPYLSGGSEAAAQPEEKIYLLFGRLFDRHDPKDADEEKRMVDLLIRLGKAMTPPEGNALPPEDPAGDSDIPAGYTYLGQFIAHEITYHDTHDLEFTSQPLPLNSRSPQIDLDSLYGSKIGEPRDPRLYEPNGARFRVGETTQVVGASYNLPNDLFREIKDTKRLGHALIGDERNDENLLLAQTHLAFTKFHNKVVDRLEDEGCPPEELFERARRLVVQHFQWIVLEDYLPRLLDRSVLRCAREHTPFCYKGGTVFMPIEFSAAAFRIGHSMVRSFYHLNTIQSGEPFRNGKAHLKRMFEFTKFSGELDGKNSLSSDWVMDWRRFYDFDHLLPPHRVPPAKYRNKARKIDTLFSMSLKGAGFPQQNIPEHLRAITIRNLLRGYSFGLPTGEQAAEQLGVNALKPEEVRRGPHEDVLLAEEFEGRTPLWYYVLKEAELNGGGRLGPVGSRIVAETFVALIRQSPYSILKEPGWQPSFGWCRPGERRARFEMADLISFADVVDPIGKKLGVS